MAARRPLGIFAFAILYIIWGILSIPAGIGAYLSYVSYSSSENIWLGIILLALVLIPFVIARALLNGYKIGWLLAVLFSIFNMAIVIIAFALLRISFYSGLIYGPVVTSLINAVEYSIVLIGVYSIIILVILLNALLLYYLTRKGTRRYFGM